MIIYTLEDSAIILSTSYRMPPVLPVECTTVSSIEFNNKTINAFILVNVADKRRRGLIEENNKKVSVAYTYNVSLSRIRETLNDVKFLKSIREINLSILSFG